MLKQLDFYDLNKKVKLVESIDRDQIALVFDDGTFFVIKAVKVAGAVEFRYPAFQALDFANSAVDAGILSESELFAEFKRVEKEIAEKSERAERAEYERLKKKFES